MNDRVTEDFSTTTSAGLWRGTSRADRDGARRERLLEAALELYGTLGFRGTSIQALCQESGVSSRSFYELFPARGASSSQEALSAQEALLEQLYIVLHAEIG
ncbi:TetR/AcrR family transcriptional regulator, partial [Brevibacterium sp.]|uniref:TetR/AcrR family transcriptional regulator n=1 Tax=Brevibacterium sp. TaxID=1701 RepID=UPI00264A0B61